MTDTGELDCWSDLLAAARALRAAQRDYMANRGDEARGKEVGRRSEKLDEAIAAVERAQGNG